MVLAMPGASSSAGGSESLSKMLMRMRGQEVVKQVRALGFMHASIPKEKLQATLVPMDDKWEEKQYVFEGAEKLNSIKFNVANLYKWDDCTLFHTDARGITKEIKTTDELQVIIETHRMREEVRRLDVMEGDLETVRSMLLASRAEMHLLACISLWRIVSRRDQHGQIGASVFMLLPKVLKSTDVHVSRLAAATVWMLAQEEATLRRMPCELIVKAIVKGFTYHLEHAQFRREMRVERATENADGEGADSEEDEEGGGAKGKADEPPDTPEPPETPGTLSILEAQAVAREKAAAEAAEAFERHEEIVLAASGKGVHELSSVPVRALSALLRAEAGRRAFHQCGGCARLVPFLCAADAPLAQSVFSFFARVTALSPTLCGDTLYRGGARHLVEMASGLNGAMGYLERCGAAELLHFCLSRVRLTPERATDRELLRELPALVHILRVCTVPLFLPIQKGIKLAHPVFAASLPEKELLRCFQNAENALVLLRGLIGTIWGMAAALRNFGQPLHITGTLYSFLLRCLSFSVDKSCGFKLAVEFSARRAEHALVLRNTALGVLACCEMKADYALKPADLSEIEQEAAVKKLQGMRRAQMLRRKAIAEEKARLEREAEIERRRKAGMSAFMDEDESPSSSPTNGQRSRRASTDMRFTRKHKETDRAMALVEKEAREAREKADAEREMLAPADVKPSPPKILPTQLLHLLEVIANQPADRFAECCSAALCSLINTPGVPAALQAVDALKRLLALCAQMQERVQSEDGALHGHAAVAHGYLAAATLSLLAARVEAQEAKAREEAAHAAYLAAHPPPPPRPAPPPPPPHDEEKGEGSPGGRKKKMTAAEEAELAAKEAAAAQAKADAERLERARWYELNCDEAAVESHGRALRVEQLRTLVGMLPASQPGALHGAACLWLQANCGALNTLGDLGAVEALARVLQHAVEEKHCTGSFLIQANWAAAALWRLCHAPRNAARALACAAPALLRLLPSGASEMDSLRKAALGCISLMFRQEELQPPLVHMAAPYLLQQLAAAPTRPPEQRLTASRTLDGTIGTVSKLLPPVRPPLPKPIVPMLAPAAEPSLAAATPTAAPIVPAPSVPVAEEGPASAVASADVGLEHLMLTLLDDKNAELRALGCRGLARAAMRGHSALIVEKGGPKLLVTHTLRSESERFLHALEKARVNVETLKAAAAKAEAAVPAAQAKSPAEGKKAVAAAAAAQAAYEKAESAGAPDCPLLRDALNAVLNLSGSRCAQVPLARYGLWTFVQLWYDLQQYAEGDEKLLPLLDMASSVLVNLCSNPANRTSMYRAELQLKTALCSGQPLRTVRPSSPPPQLEGSEDALDDVHGGEADVAELAGPAAEGDGDAPPPSAAGAAPKAAAPKTAAEESTTVADVHQTKKREYVDWLTHKFDELEAEEALKKAEEARREREEMESDPTGTFSLAKTAFQMIDEDGSNELSRTELIRAFRLNDKVRELLLPLLPADVLRSKSDVCGINVQAQVEAFEIIFQRMDMDGSDAVTLEEFTTYFANLGLGMKPGQRKPKKNSVLNFVKKPDKLAAKAYARRAAAEKAILDAQLANQQRAGSPEAAGAGAGTLSLPALKAAANALQEHKSVPAPGLQRMLQMSFTDTWKRGSRQPATSPRAAGSQSVGAAVRASARAELDKTAIVPSGSSPRVAATTATTAPKPSARATAPTLLPPAPGAAIASSGSLPRLPKPKEGTAAKGGGSKGGMAKGEPPEAAVVGASKPVDLWAPGVKEVELLPEEPSAVDTHEPSPPQATAKLSKSERQAAAASAVAAPPPLEQWEIDYLSSEAPLRFKVSLPSMEEYTPVFKFAGPEGATLGRDTSQTMGGKLISWVAPPPQKQLRRVAKHTGHEYVGSRIAEELGFKGFELPNGKTLRLFHASTKRNWRAPHMEPEELEPSTLLVLGLHEMPAHPPPPQPSKRDLPKLPQSEVRPIRPKALVKAEAGSTSAIVSAYASLVDEEKFVLTVQPKSGATELFVDKARLNQSFDLFSSVFAGRRIVSDARSFYDDPVVTQRSFEIDFARCNQERFRLLIKAEDDDTANASGAASESIEIGEIKEVLNKHREMLYRAFTYYAALGAVDGRGDGYSVCLEEYELFCKSCKLADEKSSWCKAVDLVDLFYTTNEEEATGMAEQSEANAVNADKALMRFEWFQVIVRLAIAKYVKAQDGRRQRGGVKRIADVSDALDALLTHDVAPNLPPEACVETMAFRERRLYVKPVNDAFESNATMLKAIYDFYAASADDEGAPPQIKGAELFARSLFMSIQEWILLLEDANVFDDSFTRREAVLAFVWSQSIVTDEVKRREPMMHLSYADFQEALCRALAFKSLPSTDLMKTVDARSVSDFYTKLEAGVIPPELTENMRVAYDWREGRAPEGAIDRSIRPQLETFLALIFERLSTASEHLTRKVVKERLEARAQAKREAAELRRQGEIKEKDEGLFGEIIGALGTKAQPE
eukprot:jgi/Chrpa1/3310/Chrysochromulina_OHIO_Genome00019189-RA